jgi:hypothetical protein
MNPSNTTIVISSFYFKKQIGLPLLGVVIMDQVIRKYRDAGQSWQETLEALLVS